MQLKDYQIKVLDQLDRYLQLLREKREEAEAFVEFQRQRGKSVEPANYCKETWDALNAQGQLPLFRDARHGTAFRADYIDRHDGIKRPIPNICFKVPTAGGKTLLAASALDHLNADYFRRQTGFVLWVVPSDSIYTQTWKALANREHPYRQLLERASGGRVRLLEKADNFTRQDTEEYLCVMLLMLQSSARQSKDTLKMFQDSGRFESFFPPVDDFLAGRELIQQVPNLETNDLADAGFTPGGVSLRQSLGNVLRLTRPIIVIDEGHRAYSETARTTLQGFNPRFILELSATPNTGKVRVSNLLVDISGTELKAEQMIKMPLNVVNIVHADWKRTLTEAHAQLDTLKAEARRFQSASGRYIRPIMIVRVDRTGNDQRGGTELHAEDVREFLQDKLSVKPEAIAVKSASLDEIGVTDLLDPSCEIRYIITKDALREGWDCPFAYILALLSRTTAQTAMTQMIGRILRQPDTVRTGVATLDQSYVFCFDQEVEEAANAVRRGLEEEGMGDLSADVRTGSAAPAFAAKPVTVGRRDRFKGMRIFLPQVLCRDGTTDFRPIDYERDILRGLDWESFHYTRREDFTPDAHDKLEKVVTQVDMERNDSGDTDFSFARDVEEMAVEGHLDIPFLTRLLTDVIPNPWQAVRILEETLESLAARGVAKERVFTNRLSLIKEMKADLQTQVNAAAETLFRTRLAAGEINFHLVSAGDAKLNWELAETIDFVVTDADPILRKRNAEPLDRTLYERIYEKEVNPLEKEVAWYLDGDKAIRWWHRLVSRQDYYVQGWQRHKVYPDFLACVEESEPGKVRLTLLETKGMHLSGNPDTEYKRRLFDLLTEHTATRPVVAGELELHRDSGDKMVFKLLLADTWRADIQAGLTSEPPQQEHGNGR